MVISILIQSLSILFFLIYSLLSSQCCVPKMPTASSAQKSKRASRIAKQKTIRCLRFFTFLITSSHRRPVPSSKTPAAIKSNTSQFTSFVNCIAINGMSNRSATVSTMMLSLLFCIIINVFISLRWFCYIIVHS